MEGRMMRNYRQVSPERAKVWREKSPKYYYNYEKYNQQKQQTQHDDNGKAHVIYYLCRNGQLEHPHYMEVAQSSIDGLYLRDVIERLNVLRGRGMASMYSWSCKRSHKGGFVWHDLCEDDLLIPAHGTEYVLKGVELFEDSNPGCFSPVEPLLLQDQKALPEPPPSSRSQEDSSSASSLNGVTTTINSQDDSSPDSGKTSWNGSLSLTEYKVYKSDGLSNASTQTEEKTCKNNLEICPMGSSTDDDHPLLLGNDNPNQNRISRTKETPDNSNRFASSPPPSTPSTSSSGRTDTLESVVRTDDARKLSSFRILEEEEFRLRPSSRFKASNMLLQLVSCGSISVKDDRSFGLVPTYKPKFSHSKIPSPYFPTSLMAGEIDFSKDNPHIKGMRLEDKEYFSGSLVETSMVKEGLPSFKRSSSYKDERSGRKVDSVKEKEDVIKKPLSESTRLTRAVRNGENVIKIEERLASGARVIIQSKVSVDNGTIS